MWLTGYLCGLPFPSGRKSAKRAATLDNDLEFLNEFSNHVNTALDIFRWEGLPDTCDARTIERSFLMTGKAMICDDGGILLSPMTALGAGLNIYGYPTKAWGYGANGYNKEFTAQIPGSESGGPLTYSPDGGKAPPSAQAVIGYDNRLAYPYINYIFVAARRMADLIRSCDVTVKNLKLPVVVTCDETQVESVKTLFKTRDDNLPVIIGSKQLRDMDAQVLNLNIPPETLSLFWEHYRNIESQLLERLGINSNDQTQKRERLLVDEINANNEEINANLAKRLECREIWAEQVNKRFGLNIKPVISKTKWEEDGIYDPDEMDGEEPGEDTGAMERDGNSD